MTVGRLSWAIAGLAVAFLFGGAAKAENHSAAQAECPSFPTVSWWGDLSHDKAIRYVVSKHDGDWSPYVKKWQRQLISLQKIQVRGGTVVFKKRGLRLRGADLDDYVLKVKERVLVNTCLAEMDEIKTTEAEADELAMFSTAAGSSDVDVAARVETEQVLQARAALKSAEIALRSGNRTGLDAAIRRLREVLGE